MKSIIIYSSLTGNTKALAEAALGAMPPGAEICPVAKAPAPEGYDLLALGFWVSKSGPDPKSAAYLARVRGQRLILFGSMAGYPDSDYGERVRANATALADGNSLLGVFLCQGRISEKRFAAYLNGDMQNTRHPLTPERKARLTEAQRHPNQDDFNAARQFFAGIVQKLRP